MFELACHTWGFSDMPLEEAVQTIARLGFSYIDLGSGPHLDVDAAARNPAREARGILDLLETFHLTPTDLYIMLPALSSADEGRRLYEVRLFERLLPFAAELGVPGITLSPGIETPEITEARLPQGRAVELRPPGKPDPDADMVTYRAPDDAGDPDEQVPFHSTNPVPHQPTPFDYAIESFQRIVEIIEDTDLRISFEPHLDSVTPTPEKTLALLEAVPGLSLTLDWAQFTAQGIISSEIEPLLQHTAHVQLRQAARGRLQTAYHEGIIDLGLVVELLVANDYRGAISIEYMNRSGWHGLTALDIVREIGLTRDEIRNARKRVLAGH
ncbi:MAG: sugar phosphate isomerase/epimerase [Anaerolineae bacterium]|nr:sugar phosphate isomerase/epimerase [Anaerolineae bacterium]